MKKWLCTICGHIHEGNEPPENCPICGASREKFVLMTDKSTENTLEAVVDPEITTADILVVGGGAAALGAACTALGAGASVIILEKADQLGGTTARSGGGYWIPCNSKQKKAGFKDNEEDAIRYMARYSYPNQFAPEAKRFGLTEHQFELIESYVNNAHVMVDHLEKLGALRSEMEINWTGKPNVDYMDHLPENKGIRGRTLFPVDADGNLGMGFELISQLEKYIKDKGGIVHTGYRVSKIIMDAGRAVGLVAEANGKKYEFTANKGIVFGSGGYSHDLELMTSLQRGPHYGGCAVPTNTGDFIKMAGSIGAAIGNTAGAFRAQSMIDAYLANPGGSSSVFYIPGDSVILVNKYGKRVVDEKRNYTDRAMLHFAWDALKAEWTNLLTFMIYDERTATLWQGYPPYPVQGEALPNYLLKADTMPALVDAIKARLKELAPHTGNFSLDDSFTSALLETVKTFNGYAKDGVDTEFHRGENAYDREWTTFPPTIPGVEWPEKETKNYTMHPISAEGPFYAIVLSAGTLDTNGGPVVNRNAQVLGWDANVIAGLYGAGNCIASPTANAYWGAGSTIGPALTQGFVAVNHALSETIDKNTNLENENNTAKNLMAAFTGEAEANRKYTAYARKAEQEGRMNAAKLFRAASDAETLHALRHFEVAGKVGSTQDNLKDGVKGETYEYKEMYPPFIKEAEEAGNKAAVMSFTFAMKAEEVHAGLYQDALENLDKKEEVFYYLCPVCGNIEKFQPEKCSICGVPGAKFIKY